MRQIRSDSNSGGLKNQEKISQLCAVGISFPTKGTSFKQKELLKLVSCSSRYLVHNHILKYLLYEAYLYIYLMVSLSIFANPISISVNDHLIMVSWTLEML